MSGTARAPCFSLEWYGEGAVPPTAEKAIIGGTAPSPYQSKVTAPSLYQVIFLSSLPFLDDNCLEPISQDTSILVLRIRKKDKNP